MKDLPHHYKVSARAGPDGDVNLSSESLPDLPSAAPVEFGGPGGRWSPETLLIAAIADCYVLSFRAIARASRLAWTSLDCAVEGKLERSEGVTLFTEFEIRANLELPADGQEEQAQRLLQKAQSICLITNSLSGKKQVHAQVHKTA